MRVLWLTSYAPWPAQFGGARRTYHLIEQAAQAGHAIHLVAFGPPGAAEQEEIRTALGRLGVTVQLVVDPAALPASQGEGDPAQVARKRRGQLRSLLSPRPYQYFAHYSPAMQAALDRLAGERWDLAQVEYSQMGYYRLPGGVPGVLDLHNVEYEVLVRAAGAVGRRSGNGWVRKLYNKIEAVKFRWAEPGLWRRFQMILTTSERDRRQVLAHLPECEVTVVPNGVDMAYFHPQPPSLTLSPEGGGLGRGAGPQIVFTGMMAYYPNQEGALWFADAIWPLVRRALPEARLLLVGAEPPPVIRALVGRGAGIEVTGSVPDVRPYVWAATLCVVPLRIGGGTRLKIVEALAMEKAVVSTTIGCEGLDVVAGETLLVADDPAQFAAIVVATVRDPARRAALGRAGRTLTAARYAWPAAAAPMLAAWERLVRGGG